MTHVEINDLIALNDAFGSLGTNVGPRLGPDKRTQDAKEWFVLRHFMAVALPAGLFPLPVTLAKVQPPGPDFAMTFGPARKPALIEITEASHPKDQREMTKFAESDKDVMLLGDYGGRFAGGASQPKFAWTSDIAEAILRKQSKSICTSPAPDRHLIIYPNSNASRLICDEEDERTAFVHLKEVIERDHRRYAGALNECQVHVLGTALVCVDLIGTNRLLQRPARETLAV
jgi:hypothetical protein